MMKNPFNLKCLKIFSLIFFLSFFTSDLYAQLAGTSGSITICTKETYDQGLGNPIGTLDLFSVLTGATSGGTWTETTMAPCNLTGGGAFNAVMGKVDTWKVKRGCIYQFTYTATDGSTSTVTLNLGGYPGFGADALVCEKESKYNLFATMGKPTDTPSRPNPDALANPPTQLAGGTFSSNAPAGTINPMTGEFDATLPQMTDPFYPTFIITYTVPAVGTCPARSTTFNLTIQKKAEPGTVFPLYLCETDYLSFSTAFDLQSLFNPTPVRDSGGDWSDETLAPFGPGGGTTYPLSSGISNSADSVINIRDIYDQYVLDFGHDLSHTDKDIKLSFKYTVFATNPICPKEEVTINITIERVIDLNGAPPITATPPGVCLNDATTTPIKMTINQNPMYPVEDGSYDISYTLSGPNAASAGGSGIKTVTFAGGKGDITLMLTAPVAVGVTTLCITNAVENDSQLPSNMPPFPTVKCSRPITPPICGSFEVYAAPDPSDTQVVVNDVCLGGTNTVTISDINAGNGIQLVNGTYDVTYTLSCGGSGTLTFVVSGGTGTATLPIIPLDGPCTITLTLFTNVMTTCASLPTSISDTFLVNLVPDGTLMTVNTPDICVGNTLIVNLAGITSAPNGPYDITYNITGAPSNPYTQSVILTGGAGSFTPIPVLPVGTYTITITNISNGTCGTSVFTTPSDTFDVLALPTIAGVVLTVADICETQNATVNMNDAPGAPDLANGTYIVHYTLNSVAQPDVTVVYNSGSTPGGSFIITMPPTGTNTVSITSVTNSAGCTSTDGPVSTTFKVNPLPTINSSNVSVNDICQNDAAGATVTITGLANGNYTIDYSISGANTGGAIIPFTVSSGIGTFVILAGSSNPGITTVTINSITNTATGCVAILNGVQANFTVNPNPSLVTGQLAVADICLGNNATGTISGASGLDNGTYNIIYSISNPSSGPNMATTTITSNAGTFTIPSGLLTSPGSTTITITQITNTTTGCTSGPISVTATFNIIPSVDVTPSTATVAPNPVCINTNVVVTINTPLTAGTYSFDYILNGVTFPITGQIINGLGQGSFTIPGSQLPSGGIKTLVMQNFSSGGCPSTGSFSTTFTVTETLPPTLNAGGNIFCILDGPTIATLIGNLTPSTGITVYNAPTGGTAYATNTPLEDALTYYASQTANGCESETRLPITVDLTNCPNAQIVIPDGFSPNGDGINEVFEILFIDLLYPAYGLEIYNRYGAIVYKGNINTPKFNGKSQTTVLGSDVLPVGIYFYILNYNDATGKKPVQGRLYLSR